MHRDAISAREAARPPGHGAYERAYPVYGGSRLGPISEIARLGDSSLIPSPRLRYPCTSHTKGANMCMVYAFVF